jgi:hypothetical protein
MRHHTSPSPVSDAILWAIKRSGIYTIQLIARKIGAAYTDEETSLALQWLIREGEVEACAPFMGSVSYKWRESSRSQSPTRWRQGRCKKSPLHHEKAELTQHARSLTQQSAPAAIGWRRRVPQGRHHLGIVFKPCPRLWRLVIVHRRTVAGVCACVKAS